MPTDRDIRRAILHQVWSTFQRYYPYWDVVDTDWNAAFDTALRSAATDPHDDDDEAFTRTLRRFVAALHDGHAAVVHATDLPGLLFVPPLAWDWIEDHLVVTAGPAPLRPGDVVLEIDGTPAAEALAAEEGLTSAATPHHRRARALATLAAGRQDTEIRLTLQPAEGLVRTVSLRRSQPADGSFPATVEIIQEIHPGILYVDLRRATDDDFRNALLHLAVARGIVFDLRGHPRISKTFLQHLTDQPLDSPHWDLPVTVGLDGTITWHRSHWTLHPEAPRLRGKLAFLTNGAAISYAETLLGIVEHYELGAIVGSPTGGTNGNTAWLHLPGGYAIRWTCMRVMKHDGTRHHGVGIQPTVPVSPTLAGVRAGRDEVLEKAVEVTSRRR
ncbi:MAG TPA: S41 family peptidase [Thermoanaerobaculia bacterium]|jgi:C-terminal processing protease CtpA/Prc|nr:S41 family peptidase [Thermoanaerobaculia bacterium]